MGPATVTPIPTDGVIDGPALLRLLQLASPALPVGAYAYSQGLESAVERGWVKDESTAGQWILGLLGHPLTWLDVPLLARLHHAWAAGDDAAVNHWNGWLFASREAAELQAEDHHLGGALARLLADLGLVRAQPWRSAPQACFATLFALAAVEWGVPCRAAATGYVWAWCENQAMAATRLVPLGQTAGQRILSRAMPEITAAVDRGLALDDDDLGFAAPGLALAGMLHETQYSRLFRS
ncbi:MAG: urease accessory protein UreF [Pseudomonadota bacterium]|nr:urease accessory protein UreF [Pseudomonadota bacterium]